MISLIHTYQSLYYNLTDNWDHLKLATTRECIVNLNGSVNVRNFINLWSRQLVNNMFLDFYETIPAAAC